jgi:hypothetical protein
MNINSLARVAWIGMAYVYTIRLIGTFYHGIFGHVTAAGTVTGLNILAGLAQLLFFIFLYRQFVPKGQPALRTAALLAIIGSAVGLLPKLLVMTVMVQPQSLSCFIRHSPQVGAFFPWLTSALLLAFSVTFFLNDGFRRADPLKRAFAAGAAGWFVMAAAQTLVIINYLTGGRPVWLADIFSAGPIVYVASSTITFLGLSVFYLSFAHRRFTIHSSHRFTPPS